MIMSGIIIIMIGLNKQIFKNPTKTWEILQSMYIISFNTKLYIIIFQCIT